MKSNRFVYESSGKKKPVRQKEPGKLGDKSFRTSQEKDEVDVGGKLRLSKVWSPERINVLCRIFGSENVYHEIKKFEQGSSNQYDYSASQMENKEIFDGVRYLNVPIGEKNDVTESALKAKKQQGVSQQWKREITIKSRNEMKQIVIGELYVPYDQKNPESIDTQGHACTAEEIEKAAYRFMEDMNLKKVDMQHNFVPGFGCVVESYIAKQGDPMFVPGSWIVGVKITDDQVWSKIMKGEITGFSLAGSARLEEK